MKIINEFIPNTGIFAKQSNGIANSTPNKDNFDQFSNQLKTALDKVNEKQLLSEKATENFIKGDEDIHSVMLKGEEAKMSLELAVQIKNKVIEAYQELNRMQL